MDVDNVWAIVFGSADGPRLTRVAEFVATLPRLCQAELRSCDVGYSASGRVLLVIARFAAGGPSADVRRRLEFWAHHENGRAVELSTGRSDERPHEALLRLCEQTIRAVPPSTLSEAVGGLLGQGASLEIAPRRHRALVLDAAVDGSGLAFEGRVHHLFIPSPLALPSGDQLALHVVTDDGSRTCEARVVGWREGGFPRSGVAAGIIVELVTPSSELLATLAARRGRTLRRSPRYDVHLPAHVEAQEPDPRVQQPPR